jgi:hypothetical protein
MIKRVAILGKGASWIEAPFDCQDIEIWGLNDLFKYFNENTKQNRFSRWFEIHNKKDIAPEEWEFLKKLPIPVYMQQCHDDIKTSIQYPKNEIEAFFKRKLWRCSTAYMIALAIYEQYEEIQLFGVNMSYCDVEYSEQKPSVEYWLGQAEARGIKIIIHESSDILKVPFDYGYKKCPVEAEVFEQKIAEITANKDKLLKQKVKHEQQIGAINAQLFKLDGMLQISEYYKKLIY